MELIPKLIATIWLIGLVAILVAACSRAKDEWCSGDEIIVNLLACSLFLGGWLLAYAALTLVVGGVIGGIVVAFRVILGQM